ncbi:MAG: DNA primase [Chloroflexi bacterium]|jgi:DNA primase|uniref:DNA primase n=1 Tax=Candidatus Flexifilum breve TaxID=3140694 RepID=UPI003136B02E|nr:DNA primase [Chloroflexota bacterium]
MSVADEIKSRLDIVQYISKTVPLKRAGSGRWKAPCPFHHEKTPSFLVDENRQTWRCFGACATGGDIFNYVMKQNGWTFHEALEALAKEAGIDLKPQSPEAKARDQEVDRLRGLLKVVADYYHELLKQPEAREVLKYARKKRGLTEATIEQFGIGYAPDGWRYALDMLLNLGYTEDDAVNAGIASKNDSGRVYDRFRNRLIIPIRDERGRVAGFGARALAAEDNPKYLNSPQSALFDKGRLLFGLDLAAKSIRDSGTAVIVEGYLDAIQAHQAGYTNVVAQMGTALTEMQLKLIAPKWAKKIILALDSDAAGQNATKRSVEVARETLQYSDSGTLAIDIRVLAVPGAKDPDDFIRETPEGWAQLVEAAQPVVDYLIEAEKATLPSRPTLADREAVALRLLPILTASENDLSNGMNVIKLSAALALPQERLEGWMLDQANKLKASTPAPKPPPMPEPPRAPVDSSDDMPDFDSPRILQRAVAVAPILADDKPPLELDCLRILFTQPDLYYHVNRKFRELAGDNPLLQATLSDLSSEDFTRTAYRTLMQLFMVAVAQDEMDFAAYVRTHLPSELFDELNSVLADQWAELRGRVTFGADLDMIRQDKRTARTVDPSVDLIVKVLLLRRARLERERQEMLFLSVEDGDIMSLINGSVLAKRLIDAELNRRAQSQRS